MKVLIMGAHADDDVLGMGGTIAWHTHVQGDEVYSVVVTDSSSTQYPGDHAIAEQKRAEATRAAQILGIREFYHLGQPDMRLDTVPHVEINAIVEKFIHDLGPDIVYCPHPDVNKDHVAVYESVIVATRPIPGQCVRTVCTYPLISSTEWLASIAPIPFIANRYVDIEHTLAFKLLAMSCYKTELRDFPHPRSLEGIRVYAQAAGVEVGVRYAEKLCIVRQLDAIDTGPQKKATLEKISRILADLGHDVDALRSVNRLVEVGELNNIASQPK